MPISDGLWILCLYRTLPKRLRIIQRWSNWIRILLWLILTGLSSGINSLTIICRRLPARKTIFLLWAWTLRWVRIRRLFVLRQHLIRLPHPWKTISELTSMKWLRGIMTWWSNWIRASYMLISIVETCVVRNAIFVLPSRITARRSSVIRNLPRLISTVD